jgi:hypothetical protein
MTVRNFSTHCPKLGDARLGFQIRQSSDSRETSVPELPWRRARDAERLIKPQRRVPDPGPCGASLRRCAPKGDGSTEFPIRRGTAFVPIELAKLANLRHDVRAFLILPLMVTGAS